MNQSDSRAARIDVAVDRELQRIAVVGSSKELEHRWNSNDDGRSTKKLLVGRETQSSGGDIEEAIPDPISNSEVKLLGADGTARFLVWESRTLPG